eukprot:TRINITY_DN39498_c0_g1_i1.p1 TRINITY_DN39498_c0_g1~~TRINITY_DN39498_c0_g1_i1.p1  ORF type:complete len:864 (+),score=305.10 TRINITY_DN39498_c0_g1_i1:59-2593(+)
MAARPGHEVDDTAADVDQLFLQSTVDQIRQTVVQKRKEAVDQQKELRTLVGDRYHDLLAASDMIVGMGDVCDAIVEAFESSQGRTKRGAAADGDSQQHADGRALHEVVPQLRADIQQVSLWTAEGHCLEAALAVRHARRQLQQLQGGQGYLGRLLSSCRVRLTEAPAALARRSAAALKAALRTEAAASAAILKLCSEAVATVALLRDDGGWTEALQSFVQNSKSELCDNDGGDSASAALSLYFCVRNFIHQAFIAGTHAVLPCLHVTATAVVSAAVLSKDPGFRELENNVAPTAHFDDGGLDVLPSQLPPPDAARAVLRSWDADAAPIAVQALRQSLSEQRAVAAVAELQTGVLDICQRWMAAGGPSVDGDYVQTLRQLLDDRLRELLRDEMAAFKDAAERVLKEFAESDDAAMAEAPRADEQQLAKRYCLRGKARRLPEAARDPSLPDAVRLALEQFDSGLAKAIDAAAVARRCLHDQPARGAPATELFAALQATARLAEKLAVDRPRPSTALVVQGISRIIAHAAYSENGSWLRDDDTGKRLPAIHQSLNAVYLSAHQPLRTAAATAFRDDVAAVLAGTYWGPDSASYKAAVAAVWETREGSKGAPGVSLPSSPTPGLLLALRKAASNGATELPSLTRAGAIDSLHVAMADVAAPLYAEFIRSGRAGGSPRVCREALWQLLFDLRFLIAVLGGTSADAVKEKFEVAVKVVLDSAAGGIDRVDWQFHSKHFERLLLQCLAATQLLLAVHGVAAPEVPADGQGIDREAKFFKLAPECDRLPTLHLAPLPTKRGAGHADAGTSSAPGGGDQLSGTRAGLSGVGLQQLLGSAGLSQLAGPSKFFNW